MLSATRRSSVSRAALRAREPQRACARSQAMCLLLGVYEKEASVVLPGDGAFLYLFLARVLAGIGSDREVRCSTTGVSGRRCRDAAPRLSHGVPDHQAGGEGRRLRSLPCRREPGHSRACDPLQHPVGLDDGLLGTSFWRALSVSSVPCCWWRSGERRARGSSSASSPPGGGRSCSRAQRNATAATNTDDGALRPCDCSASCQELTLAALLAAVAVLVFVLANASRLEGHGDGVASGDKDGQSRGAAGGRLESSALCVYMSGLEEEVADAFPSWSRCASRFARSMRQAVRSLHAPAATS